MRWMLLVLLALPGCNGSGSPPDSGLEEPADEPDGRSSDDGDFPASDLPDEAQFFNQRMAEISESLGGHLVDNHGVFFEHGMNAAGSDRWISDDCTHPTNQGHHQLRREEWMVLTGQRY